MSPDSSLIRRATVCARDAHSLVLEVSRQEFSCSACNEGRGCGAGLLRFSQAPGRFRLKGKDWPELRPGDFVDLQLPSRVLLRMSLLGYGIPLLFFVLTAVLTSLWLGELWVAALSVLALAAGAKLGNYLAERISLDLQPSPVAQDH